MIIINRKKISETDSTAQRLLSEKEIKSVLKDKNGNLIQWGNSQRHIYWQAGDNTTDEWKEWNSLLSEEQKEFYDGLAGKPLPLGWG